MVKIHFKILAKKIPPLNCALSLDKCPIILSQILCTDGILQLFFYSCTQLVVATIYQFPLFRSVIKQCHMRSGCALKSSHFLFQVVRPLLTSVCLKYIQLASKACTNSFVLQLQILVSACKWWLLHT